MKTSIWASIGAKNPKSLFDILNRAELSQEHSHATVPLSVRGKRLLVCLVGRTERMYYAGWFPLLDSLWQAGGNIKHYICT
jgi:hypothetical protein